MSIEPTVPVEQPVTAPVVPTGTGTDADQSTSKDTVQYDTYKKVLAEKKRVQEQNASIQQQLDQLLMDQKTAEESKMVENQEYKKLLDLKAEELTKTVSELTSMRSAQANAVKLDAFLNAIGGKVDRKYWGLVDLESIVVDPSTGLVEEMSVTKLVETFRKEHGRLIDTLSASNQLPNKFPKGTDGKASGFAEKSLTEKQKELAEFLVNNT